MVRYYVVFLGQVQGVGFRWTALNLAKSLSLTGWIRNLENGNVDMEIQGDKSSILTMINKLINHSLYIHVDDYSMKKISLKDEREFNVIG